MAPVRFQVDAFKNKEGGKRSKPTGLPGSEEHGEKVLSVSLQPPKEKLKQHALFETQINIKVKEGTE